MIHAKDTIRIGELCGYDSAEITDLTEEDLKKIKDVKKVVTLKKKNQIDKIKK